MLRILTFGGLSIERDGQAITGLLEDRVKALLVYLACTRRPWTQEILAELLWEEELPDVAFLNLRAVLSSLRENLGDYVSLTAENVALNWERDIWLDVHKLKGRLGAAQLEEAVELYKGPFLDGYFVNGAPVLNNWVTEEREKLHHTVVDALQSLVVHRLASGDLKEGMAHGKRLLELAPSMQPGPWQEKLLKVLSQEIPSDKGEHLSTQDTEGWHTERAQARAEREHLLSVAQTQARRQAALLRLSAELAAAPDADQVCRRVVDGLHDTLGYDFLAMLLLEEATGELVLAASAGFEHVAGHPEPRQGLSERPRLDGELHYTPDLSKDPRWMPGMGGSEVDIPVRVGERVLGVLSAESMRPHAFGQDDFEVLTAVAQQAGLAIEKARLLAAERQRADELDALRTTMADITAELELPTLLQAIVERAAALMKATGGELGLFDETSQELRIVVSHNLGADFVGTRHALGEGAMGRVAQTGEPLIIKDYQTWQEGLPQYSHIHATLAAPLQVGGRLVGVFTTVSVDPDREFTLADLYLLSFFAQQAAIAVNNAWLYEQAQREIAERARAQEELREYQDHLEELVQKRTVSLRESEERYRSLFDGVPVGLYRTTPSGEIVEANLAQVQMLGYPNREALLAVNSAQLYVDLGERERWQGLMEREGVVRDFQTRLRRCDGITIWVNDTARAVRDKAGNILFYEGNLEDITARKRTETELRKYREHLEELVEERTAELRKSEERYRTLFDGVPVGLYRTTPDGRVLDANPAMIQILGYPSREDLLAIDPARSVYVDSQEREQWKALMEREGVVRDFEVRLRRYDGQVVWVNDTARTVSDEQGQVLLYEGSAEDITERKGFEEELRRQKEYFEALFVNNPVAVVTADLNGNIVSWNPMAEKLFWYSPEEVIGANLDDIVANDESIRAEGMRYTHQALNVGRVRVTTQRTRKDGSLVDVELLALPVYVAEEKVGFIAIYHDITDLQDARRQAEAANHAKSVFLANMSHELRTPLNAILGFTQLLTRDPELTSDQLEYLGIISRSGEHLLALINDVLEVSKIEAGKMTLRERGIDLHRKLDALEEIFDLRAEEKGLNLFFERAEGVPQYITTDEGKLGQVLSNLLGNAVKFTQEGAVTLRVTVGSPIRDPEPGQMMLRFEVEDTGPGIAPDELPAIFDAFVQSETGRSAQEGTGLGLTISRQFARLMGGDLSVTSQLGQGSCFQFDIQVGLAPPDAAEVASGRSRRRVVGVEPDQPTYRLLVAEDSETNRQLLVKLLTKVGFEVQEASNGQQAIEVWERWEPHLIWMDMRMPVVDGYEATRRIKGKAKGQATVIVALTASAFEEDREKILSVGCDDFVRKPFHEDEVFETLTKHLGVRFAYEDVEPVVSPEALHYPAQSDAADRLAVRLASMPAEWLTSLQEATTLGEVGLITGLIDQIREQDADLAEALDALAHEFEHEKILVLIQQAGEKQ